GRGWGGGGRGGGGGSRGAVEGAERTDPGNERVVRPVGPVELESTDGARRLVVRERRPRGTRGGGIRGLPDTAVGGPDIERISVRRVGSDGVDGPGHLVVRSRILRLTPRQRLASVQVWSRGAVTPPRGG